MVEALHHPHDTLFKSAFSRKEVMIDFLRGRLPQRTLSLIDLDTLQLTNKSFVSPAGKHTHSDLIYKASLKERIGDFYVVIEHFSTPERYIPLRQMEYNLMLFRQYLKEEQKKLPPVTNICLYNGPKPYTGPTTLLEMFLHPDLIEDPYLCGYQLVDLCRDEEEKILRDHQAAFAELLLKRGRQGDFYSLLARNGSLLEKYCLGYAEEAILYILSLDDQDRTLEKLRSITQPQYQDLVMSIAQKFTQRGIAQGIEQGIAQGIGQGIEQGIQQERLGIARSMLQDRESITKILRWTGLTEAEIRDLRAAEVGQL